MGVTFGSPLTDETVYCSTLADSVDTGTFVFVCRTPPFPPDVQGGPWHVVLLGVQDWTRNRNDMDTTELRAAGFPTGLTVLDHYPDVSRPIVTGLTISPDSVEANGIDTVTVRLTVRDNSGVSYVSARFTNYTTGQTRRWDYIWETSLIEGTVSMDLSFSAAEAGWWRVDEIGMSDRTGNTAFLTRADLASLGYPTAFLVTPP